MGARNRRTRALVERVEGEQLIDVVLLLTRWANDQTQPLPFRAACAGKVAEFTHSKPARVTFDRIPLFHQWTEAQVEDFDRRLKEDMARRPEKYGVARPKPTLVKGDPPSDRWFAEIDGKIDQRRHAGNPEELARARASSFKPDELAMRQRYKRDREN
jgi:hypothetical protein